VDLENWLGIVDHYFFLVQRLDHPAIDEKLKHPDFANIRNDIPSARLIRDDFREELPPPFTELKSFPGLGDAPQDPIFLCDSTAVYLPGLSRPLIIDRVDCPATEALIRPHAKKITPIRHLKFTFILCIRKSFYN
jgi:hypothetical protein